MYTFGLPQSGHRMQEAAGAAQEAVASQIVAAYTVAFFRLAGAFAMHAVAIVPAVVCQHGRRSGFVHCRLAQAPSDDRNPTPAILFMLWKRVDAMLPDDVGISSEVEQHAILLWEVDQFARFGVPEGELACCAEGDAHGAVLLSSTLLVEGSRVVMEGLPV